VVLVELDEEIPGIVTLLARTFNNERNGFDIQAVSRPDHTCDLSGEADRWTGFRTKKSDLALFPCDFCCIPRHSIHIAAELKAPNIEILGFIFSFECENIQLSISIELSRGGFRIQIISL
jgi:hypothetical protein